MCANYEAKNQARVIETFTELKLVYDPSHPWKSWYPKQDVPAIKADSTAAMMRWGLIPFWSKTPDTPYSTFNAVSETVREKKTFSGSFKKRRCLLPADGYYDYDKNTSKPKLRYRFTLAGDEPFAFAGLWDSWGKGEESLESCTMMTTEPNALMEKYHHRMPVILHPSDYAMWLDDSTSPDDLLALCRPYNGEMVATLAPASRKPESI